MPSTLYFAHDLAHDLALASASQPTSAFRR